MSSIKEVSYKNCANTKLAYLHSLGSWQADENFEKHYGLSAGLIVDRKKKIQNIKNKEDQLIKKYTFQINKWEVCYNNHWAKACKELAQSFDDIQAFLVIPSKRNEMRNSLIKAFKESHPDAIDCSNSIVNISELNFGESKNADSVCSALKINSNVLDSIKNLVFVDDWYGTGSTMFGTLKAIKNINKNISIEFAVAGAAFANTVIKTSAINDILNKMR